MNNPAFLKNQEEAEARMRMWASLLGDEYYFASKSKKRRMKMAFCKESGITAAMVSFDTLECRPATTPVVISGVAKANKKDTNMYVEQNMTVKEKTTEDSRLEHFIGRLSEIRWEKEKGLREHFGLVRTSPKSPKELVEWIKAGDFQFTKRAKELEEEEAEWYENTYCSPWEGIKWTKVKEDTKGFKKASEDLSKLHNSYVDKLWAETDASKFAEILVKFEKEKIH